MDSTNFTCHLFLNTPACSKSSQWCGHLCMCSSVPYSGYYLLSFIFAEAIVVVLFMGLIFVHWQVLRKINPLITVKSDLCTSHMSQMLHVHLMMATVEIETRLQSNMGGSCHRRTRVQAREKQLSRLLHLGSSQRRNGGQRVPRMISLMCSLFLSCGRSISCQVA